MPTTCVGKYVLAAFCPEAPRRQTAMGYPGPDTPQSAEWYISPDFHKNSPEVFSLLYPVQPETFAMIYWNMCSY